MSYEKVIQARNNILIGTKQMLKALKNNEAKEVIIAIDADWHVTNKILEAAREKSIPVIEVESMKKLGIACGIDVGTATVAITG